eukprot:NODE_633_length_5774_cov_0.180617.p3 type:complete len:214 gc:universal NODE_633_length_5774_cov_0.180617:3163-2522(-)
MNNCKWEKCEDSYSTSKELFDHVCQAHINVMGTQKFTRECKWNNCDAKVERRHHLVSHIRIHVNFKPYMCQHCGKSYKWAHDSKRHVRKCSSNPDANSGPLSAPASMTSMSPFSPSSHSQMMSPVDFMRGGGHLDHMQQQWNRPPFPHLNFQNMNSQIMMPSPTTPPNMRPILSNFNDVDSSCEYNDYSKQPMILSLDIPMPQQKFEDMPSFF